MSGFYILDEQGQPAESDAQEWGAWFERNKHNRVVAQDTAGDAFVSTVFLGIDHALPDSLTPVLWETLIFGGDLDQQMWRYTSRADAVEGHRQAVALVSVKGVAS